MHEWPTVAERIGGRWAISLQGWLILSGIGTVGLTVSTPMTADAPAQRIALIGVGVVSALAMGLIFLLADRTAFRHRAERPVPISRVVILGVVAGLTNALMTLAVTDTIGFDAVAYPTSRIVLAPITAVPAIIAVALILADIDLYRRSRDELLQRAAELSARSEERAELTRSLEHAVQEEVQAATRSILGDLNRATSEMSREERLEMARALQRTAQNELRPLSRRLYATSAAGLPRPPRFLEALRVALGTRPLRAGWCAIAVAATSVVFLASRSEFGLQLLQVVLTGLTVYLTLLAVAAAARHWHWDRRSVLPVAALTAAITSTAKTIVVQTQLVDEPEPTRILVNLLWVPFMILVVSVVAAAATSGDDALEELKFEVDEQLLAAFVANRELVRVSRELAGHVHGTLQSTLLATAFAIENATRANDGDAFDAAVEGARAALAASAPAARGSTDLRAEVQRHIDLWSEFTEVTMTIEARPELPVDVVADVGRVVEEGIGNAKKHGGARRIHIAVEQPEPLLLRVSISDDGAGPRGGAPGLGNLLLDELAPGGWSLQANHVGVGSLLVVDLRVA